MKANLFICGIPREPIETGENSIVRKLLAGNVAGALAIWGAILGGMR